MANEKTLIDQWSVRDLEDNSELTITVHACTELGNRSLPGIQVFYMGRFVNFEPLVNEILAYKAQKSEDQTYLMSNDSWIPNEHEFVKFYFVAGKPAKVRVEVKTKSSGIETKEYLLDS